MASQSISKINSGSNHSNTGDNTGKVYVWIRPSGLPFKGSKSGFGSPNGKIYGFSRRGAPGKSSESWEWTPGFYTTATAIASTLNEEEKKLRNEVVYNFTLMPLDGSDPNTSNENEFSVTESQMNALLDSGDLMLANHWEEHDFVNRLEVETVYDEEDDGYNHDDDINNYSMDETSKNATIPSDQPPHNLIHLTHLHEPSVVHALRHRYQNSYDEFISLQNNNACGIYTDTGPILLAVNPFKSDDKGILYGKETKGKYRDEGERRWQRGESGEGVQKNGSSLPPHAYAVADRTFRTMVTRMYHTDFDYSCKRLQHSTPNDNQQTKREKTNQSVLVSGESGAGKTVTTKLLMGYLAELSECPQENTKLSGNMSIERRVLESNPIMESFGNARTVRNDNSSRFGKYIEMNFSSTPFSSPTNQTEEAKVSLVGASVETYLLEKVRLVHQSIGERNYHIFYELFSLKDGEDSYVQDGNDNIHDKVEIEGNDETSQIANESNTSLVDKFGLLNYDTEDFRMISNSDTYDRRDGVSDFDTFRDLKRAMNIMGFTKHEQNAVLGVTAALLHASNVTFHEIGEVECALDMDNPHLSYLVDLLGITKEDLNKALCYYEIVVGRGASGEENHFRELSQSQAEKGVEALIKATYGALFQYLVGRINASISGSGTTHGNVSNRGHGKSNNVGRKSRDSNKKEASIGILDIFGFESFEVNSFEQLCINYCNEALQQQFNRFVLRNEQEEYHREGISWSFIEFPENQDVLELIDSKGSGILNILHDQCRTPGASDKTFALSLYDKCSSHSRFEANSRQVAQQLFAVNHYAGSVEYNVEGFVEKNRDELPKEATDLLLSSKNEFVQTLAKILQPENTQPSAGSSKSTRPGPSKGASNRPTVGIQFSFQLHSLRQKIDDTSPHYIRCLKPNNELVPNVFDAALIANQLRCAGVIEALRVSRLGYPQRYSHQQFVSRYRMLGVKAARKMKAIPSARALVLAISDDLRGGSYNDEAIGIEVGKTKIFLVQKAYNKLEKLRRDKISSSAIAIQKSIRRLVYQKRYQSLCRSALMIQCHLRRVQAKKVVRAMRQEYSSVIIQNLWRGHVARKQFLSAKAIASWCQALYRGKLDRVRYYKIRRNSKALYLQSCWRRYVAARTFQGQLASVLMLQCAWRSKIARNEFRKLKLEARNFQVVVQERDRLREELSSLRNQLQANNFLSEDGSTDLVNELDYANTPVKLNRDADLSLQEQVDKLSTEKLSIEEELIAVKDTLSSAIVSNKSLVMDRDVLMRENERLRKELSSALVQKTGVCMEDCDKVAVKSNIKDFEFMRSQLFRLMVERGIVSQRIQFQTKANDDLGTQSECLSPSYGHEIHEISECSKNSSTHSDELDVSSFDVQELKKEMIDNSKNGGVLEAVNLDFELEIRALEYEPSPSKNIVASNAKISNGPRFAEAYSENERLSENIASFKEDHCPLCEEFNEDKAASTSNFPAACFRDSSHSLCTNSTIESESSKLIGQLSLIMSTYMDIEKTWDCCDQDYNFACESNVKRDALTGHVLKLKSEDVPLVSHQSNVGLLNEIMELTERLDDAKRANRSLRQDLDDATNEKIKLHHKFEVKCEEMASLERKNLHLKRKILKMLSKSSGYDSIRNEDRLRSEIQRLRCEIDRKRVSSVRTKFNNEVPRTVNTFQPLLSPSDSKALADDDRSASRLSLSSLDDSLSRSLFPWWGSK